MVIDFGVKNWSCGIVKSLLEASAKKTQKDPIQLIKAMSFGDRWHTMIQAEELT